MTDADARLDDVETDDRLTLRPETANTRDRLDVYLTGELSDVSRAYVQQLIAGGNVLVDGLPRKNNFKVTEGQTIELSVPETETHDIQPQDIPLDIVYEDTEIAKHESLAIGARFNAQNLRRFVGRGGQLDHAHRPGFRVMDGKTCFRSHPQLAVLMAQERADLGALQAMSTCAIVATDNAVLLWIIDQQPSALGADDDEVLPYAQRGGLIRRGDHLGPAPRTHVEHLHAVLPSSGVKHSVMRHGTRTGMVAMGAGIVGQGTFHLQVTASKDEAARAVQHADPKPLLVDSGDGMAPTTAVRSDHPVQQWTSSRARPALGTSAGNVQGPQEFGRTSDDQGTRT